jgi:hypothetical protein
MHYSSEAATEMLSNTTETRLRYYKLTMQVASFTNGLKNERAREYMQHGVSRRLRLLHRCVENIFKLFPVNQMEKLTENDRLDVGINLHAFLINIFGIIENIGLALAYENDLIGDKSMKKVNLKSVNLFDKKFKRLLNPRLKEYVAKPKLREWYRDYAKNYRDALAHRIPPYVPPAALNKEEQRQFADIDRELQKLFNEGNISQIEALQEKQASLGRSNPLFVHSFSEKVAPMYLHPQVLADFSTIEELLNMAMTNFYS